MEAPQYTLSDVPVAGIEPMTTIDFPGRMAAVFFTQGCPWNCRYCHNPSCRVHDFPVSFERPHIESFLIERSDFLDGVVISGGEPTIHPALPDFLEWIRDIGYLTALHTNGYNPEMLRYLLKHELLDYVAMDVKGSPATYDRITRAQNSCVKASWSISAIVSSGIQYEFRTTWHPLLMTEKELLDTVRAVYSAGGRRYFIQRSRAQGVRDDELVRFGDVIDVPEKVVKEARKLFDEFEVR
ncbi:anaerobic ribonucleoside-triphosphate reductase activating protein [bacterium]|nr:anaerobic ribonucleoside-triphosphate reductase activating protein [bacterium]